jgi:hypothetical protein
MQFAIGVIVLECFFAKYSHGPLGVNFDKGFSKELLKSTLQMQSEKLEKKHFPQFPTTRILFYTIRNIYRFKIIFLTTLVGRL